MRNKWLYLDQFRKLARFLGKPVLFLFFYGLVAGMALCVVEVAFAYGLQSFLSAIGVMEKSILHLPKWIPDIGLGKVLLFFLGVGIVRATLQWLQLFLQGKIMEELRFLQRTRLLRWAFHSESASSSTVTTLLTDRTNAAAAVVQNLQTVSIQLTCGLLLGFSLFFMAPLLTLACAIFLAILLLPMLSFDRKISAAGNGLNSESAKINQQLFNSIKNLLLMQIYGTQKAEEAKAQKRSQAIYDHHLVLYKYTAFKFALPQVIGLFLICLIAYLAKTQLAMPPGKLISYFYLFVRFLQTISMSAQAGSTVIQYWPQIADLGQWWATHSFDGVKNRRNLDAPTQALKNQDGPLGWRLRALHFQYPRANFPLFHDLDFTVEPGKTLVVTGASGSGKSTLLNLMLGTLSPNSGAVEVLYASGDAENIDKARSYTLDKVGYVGAESFLIEGSILDNLTYGLRCIPDPEEVRDALRKAECNFVFEMPQGLEHMLTEQGQGLSAGQKQRLSLARAFLRKPKVLILDEATANLDLDTELKLVGTLAQVKKEITIIAVTHRQALLQIADQALKLEASSTGNRHTLS